MTMLTAPSGDEYRAQERARLDADRAACLPPRVFRLREGGLPSLASDHECVSPEVIAAEDRARVAEAEARAAAATAAQAAAPPPTAPPEPPETTPVAEAAETAHDLGDEFVMGSDYSYSFDRLRLRRRIGNSFISVTASEGATYVVVEFRERNDSDNVESSMGSVVVALRDAQGRRFTPDEEAMRHALLSGMRIERGGDQMMPGVWVRREVIFQLPRESTTEPLDVVLDARGAFAGAGLVRGRAR